MSSPTPAASPSAGLDPLALVAAMRLEGGRSWGEIAVGWQREDARAVLDVAPGSPRMHWLGRPRGGSKTTDLAAVALAALAAQCPPRSRSLVYASDRDQAALVADAAAAMIARTPGLGDMFRTDQSRIVFGPTQASLSVEAADSSGAWGHIPPLVICDELAYWPETRAAKRIWEAVVSSLVKRPDARLAVLTAPGDPSHWSYKVLQGARASDSWHVHEVRGPLPWVSAETLTEQRRLLTDSAFRRLHLGEWVASEDRLVSPEDLAACVGHTGTLAYTSAHRYIVTIDAGLVNDRTIICAAHSERSGHGEPPRVVLDAIHALQGTRQNPVSLRGVEELLIATTADYGRAPIIYDPYQLAGSAERLRARGLSMTPYTFSGPSVGTLASELHRALRDHRLDLPDDEALLDELGAIRLRPSSVPGQVRMDHDSSRHDDRGIALALAVHHLAGRPEVTASISVPDFNRLDPATAKPLREGLTSRRVTATSIGRRRTGPDGPSRSDIDQALRGLRR